MVRLINTDIMKQPVNWLTVPLMVLLGAAILYMLNPLGAPQE